MREPEAPVDAPFEQFAFAGEGHREDVPHEKDTEIEHQTFKDLCDHIVINENNLDSEVISTIKEIMIQGYYPDIFKEPIQEFVMRGMSVSTTFMEKALGKIYLDQEIPAIGDEDVDFKFTLLKGTNVASWSISPGYATAVSFQNLSDRLPWKVVLTARVEDNPGYFLALKDIYEAIGKKDYAKEREVLQVNKTVKVHRVNWQHMSDEMENW